jgi:hypothetical protein
MTLDGVELKLEQVVYDFFFGGGVVKTVSKDTCEVMFNSSKDLVKYYANGTIGNIKRLHLEKPILVYATDSQIKMVQGVLTALGVRHE